MKKSSLRAQQTNSTVCKRCQHCRYKRREKNRRTYLAVIVLIQDPAPAGIDLLVALARAAHGQCRVHVHVVTRQVQAD